MTCALSPPSVTLHMRLIRGCASLSASISRFVFCFVLHVADLQVSTSHDAVDKFLPQDRVAH